MRAMLLAAGLGTRLRPLTDVLPKPAVPVYGRPLAHFAIDRLLAAGVTSLAANAHHLPHEVERVVRARMPDALVSIETELLGTGGGVRRALTLLAERDARPIDREETFIVSNADVLFAVDLTAALAAHRASRAYATMVLRRDARADSLGPIHIDANQRVRRILRVPESDAPLEAMMFTGISILSGAAVLDLPEHGCFVRQGYRRWLDRGETITAHVDAAPFRDLGTPRDYLAAHLDLLSGAVPWPGIVSVDSAVDATARVEGSVHHAFVGARAHVLRGVRIERAVVWADTVVRESASDVILFPSGRIDVG
jgi:mannose-1-phosphate guanylyltransferase